VSKCRIPPGKLRLSAGASAFLNPPEVLRMHKNVGPKRTTVADFPRATTVEAPQHVRFRPLAL
jgi:hypothetical protein